jgi:hypothetical protein
VISSTTGSPTITTDAGATVYKFTGDGTFVVGTAGVARVLIVGAGSGAYGSVGLGGGAGGMQDVSALYLPAGTYTVKIGVGTAAGSTNGIAGDSFIDGLLGCMGGGGFASTGITSGGSTAAGTVLAGSRRLGGQGNIGFPGSPGGGGGAGGAGTTGSAAGSIGPGRTSNIVVSGTPVTYAAGGQGGTTNTNGPANTGNGGAGDTGAGGSGIVVVRVG